MCVVRAGALNFMIESLWDAGIDAKALVTGAKYHAMQRHGERNFSGLHVSICTCTLYLGVKYHC